MRCTYCSNCIPEYIRDSYLQGSKPCKWCKKYIDKDFITLENLLKNNEVNMSKTVDLIKTPSLENEIPKEFLDHVEDLPNAVRTYSGHKGTHKYHTIALTLKAIGVGKCIVFTDEEFKNIFGKYGKVSAIPSLKRQGIKKPKITSYNGKVYISYTDI